MKMAGGLALFELAAHTSEYVARRCGMKLNADRVLGFRLFLVELLGFDFV